MIGILSPLLYPRCEASISLAGRFSMSPADELITGGSHSKSWNDLYVYSTGRPRPRGGTIIIPRILFCLDTSPDAASYVYPSRETGRGWYLPACPLFRTDPRLAEPIRSQRVNNIVTTTHRQPGSPRPTRQGSLHVVTSAQGVTSHRRDQCRGRCLVFLRAMFGMPGKAPSTQ